jgi:O-antigen/teichoic acid export membrane protein
LGVAGSGVLSLLTTALTWAIFPTLSAMFGRGETEPFKETLRVSQRLLNVLVMPIGFALAAVAGTAVTVAYGRAYAGAAIPFAILAVSSILLAYLSLMTCTLMAIRRTQALITIWSAAALTEIALTAILVPPLNVMGSALARVGMSTVGVLVSYAYLKDSWWPNIERTSLAKSTMLAALVGIVLFLFDSFATSVMGIGSLGRGLLDMMVFLFVYVAGLIALKPLLRQDLDMLTTALPLHLQGWLDRILFLCVKQEDSPNT